MKCVWFCILAAYVLICNVFTACGNPLYKPSDKIVLLENDTISTALFDSNFAWFVEFYSSWCGHCQSFAPNWKRLARQVEGWNSFIQVAAIDCAEARNMKTCENYSIQGYPTLKFFKALTKDKKYLGTVYTGEREPDDMQHAIVDFLEAQGNPKMKLDFKPVSTKMSDSYSEETRLPKPVALVFESNSSYLGKELMLDLMNNAKVTVKRVVNDDVRKVRYKVKRLPQVVLVLGNDKYVHLKKNQTRAEILSELRKFDVKKKTPPQPENVELTNSHYKDIHKNDVHVKHMKQNTYDLRMQDLESALTFIFTREIVIKKILHKENLERFVDLLVQCFPARPQINNFLKILHKWLQDRVKDKDRPLRPSALRLFYNMHKADNSSLPDTVEWHTCQGSRPQYRGYPCSLWLLFHTLTVNCASRRVTRLTGADVLARIRGYVKSFFSCLECSKHFYNMSKNVESEVHTHDEAILWLWRAHNKVNKRLSKEPSTDPLFPKIAYPPKDLCTECTKDSKGYNNTWNDNPSTWRDNVVLNYLKVHYGVNNILLSDMGDTTGGESVRYFNSNKFVRVIGFGMTYFDTSLCVVVYGTGVLILVMLYIYVLRRRKRTAKRFSHMA